MNLKLQTGPATEPVTITEAKDHLRVTVSDSDTLITALIVAARRICEEWTHRAFIEQTWDLGLDLTNRGPFTSPWEWSQFDTLIKIPRPPLISVTHIKTFDEENVEAIFDAAGYFVDVQSEPGRIALNDGYSWPTDVRAINAMSIRFKGGYGTAASSVPQDIRTAILLAIAHLFEHRGDDAGESLPDVAEVLLSPYRIRLV